MPREETFRIPLKYMDVTRFSHTDLDVMQEKRIDEFLTVDSNREVSDSCESKRSPPTYFRDSYLDAGEARDDFWSISGDLTYHHHDELRRVKLYTPRKESFPIPLKYCDDARVTHTTLEVLLECRIDDF